MNTEIIKEISKTIVNNTIYKNWVFYIVIFSISIIANILTSFLSSYFKKRGEDLATKNNIEEILSNTEKVVKETEDIKNTFSKDLTKFKD